MPNLNQTQPLTAIIEIRLQRSKQTVMSKMLVAKDLNELSLALQETLTWLESINQTGDLL
jgi:hypothetical protein